MVYFWGHPVYAIFYVKNIKYQKKIDITQYGIASVSIYRWTISPFWSFFWYLLFLMCKAAVKNGRLLFYKRLSLSG